MNDDFLNQDEIDALLRGQSLSDDASSSAELSEMERDTLAEIGNISMGSAATALSNLINRKVSITVPDVSVSTLDAVKESYPVPCIIVNVGYEEGLQGDNLLVIKERDAAIIGDLMMGNDGSDPPTEIDELFLSAVTEAMNVMMGSAATSMSDLFHFRINISPPDTFRRHLAEEPLNFGGEDAVVVIAFRIVIEELIDSTMVQVIEFGFATQMVEQLLNPEPEESEPKPEPTPPAEEIEDPVASEPVTSWDDLKEQAEAHQVSAEPAVTMELGNINVDLIREIPVQLRAVLGKANLSIDNILKLGPGHIMELDTVEGEPINVYANDTLIARGEVVVVGEQFGVRITEISTHRNRINSIR